MDFSKINKLSLCVFYTEVYFESNLISKATSFVYQFKNNKYLLTNYHVVFGRDAFTGKCLDKNLSIPTKLLIYYHDENFKVKLQEIVLNNYKIIKQLKEEGQFYDIALIPLNEGCDIPAINKCFEETADLMYEISDTVFVLGYPLQINVSYTPIWKAASIASEPSFNVKDLPVFYIDTATKEGMSGSPVIIYNSTGNYKSTSGSIVLNNKIKFKFLGIYSGRDTCNNETEARLGVVWKKEIIEKLINEKV